MLRLFRRSGIIAGLCAATVATTALSGAPAFAIAGGDAVTDGSRNFVAKLQIGDLTSCAGVLVAAKWVLSSASCFATSAGPVAAGVPPVRTTVTVGRNDLSGTGGRTALATKLVPRTDRDVILVELDAAVTDVTPIALATSTPAVGATLSTATFGRTATEWTPNRLQSAQFQVTTADATTLGLAGGTAAVSLCKGDAGGPLFSETGGTPTLVAINTAAWSHGCLDSAETRSGAVATIVRDLGTWIDANTVTPVNGYYQPVTAKRILDTRDGTGTSGNTTTPVPAGGTVTLQVTGRNGVPAGAVSAVALTVTSVGQTGSGTVTVFPDQVARPDTPNITYPGRVSIANFVIVPVGANGAVNHYNATGITHLVADLAGYFTVDSAKAGNTTYTPMTPKRLLDTRSNVGTQGGKLSDGGTVALTVGGVGSVPTAILAAVVLTISAINGSAGGRLTAYAHGTPRPATANLQYGVPSASVASIVPVSADGKVDIWASISTDLTADISGYFTTDATGMTFHPVTPTRLEDTRTTGAAIPAWSTVTKSWSTGICANGTLNPFKITSAAVYNVTVVAPASSGHLANYPYGVTGPDVVNISFTTARTTANLIMAPLSTADVVCRPSTRFYNSSANSINVIYDYSGSFSY